MKGPRLFEHTDWNSKKKNRKGLHVLFSLKISVESKKKVFVVRDEVPHFLQGPHFLHGPRLQPVEPIRICKSSPGHYSIIIQKL